MELGKPISLEDKERIALNFFRHNIELHYSKKIVRGNIRNMPSSAVNYLKRTCKMFITRIMLRRHYSCTDFVFNLKIEFDYYLRESVINSVLEKVNSQCGTRYLIALLFENFL